MVRKEDDMLLIIGRQLTSARIQKGLEKAIDNDQAKASVEEVRRQKWWLGSKGIIKSLRFIVKVLNQPEEEDAREFRDRLFKRSGISDTSTQWLEDYDMHVTENRESLLRIHMEKQIGHMGKYRCLETDGVYRLVYSGLKYGPPEDIFHRFGKIYKFDANVASVGAVRDGSENDYKVLVIARGEDKKPGFGLFLPEDFSKKFVQIFLGLHQLIRIDSKTERDELIGDQYQIFLGESDILQRELIRKLR